MMTTLCGWFPSIVVSKLKHEFVLHTLNETLSVREHFPLFLETSKVPRLKEFKNPWLSTAIKRLYYLVAVGAE